MLKKRVKGYFYTLDVVIAIILLVIGLLVLAGSYFYSPYKPRVEGITTDISGVLANTRLRDVCPGLPDCSSCSYTTIRDLCGETPSQIKNPELSLMEFMGQLYHDMRREAIKDIIDEAIVRSGILPQHLDMQIVLYDPAEDRLEQLYPLIT